MSSKSFRFSLLSHAFASLIALAMVTSAVAKDEPVETAVSATDSKAGDVKSDEAKVGTPPSVMPDVMRPFPYPGSPPSINRNGGTAIINFVAPVTSKTMADLAKTAQNAVIGGADAVRINISSQGGSVHAMQFAVNVLKNLSVPVETVAMSKIASAAVALFCAGEKRYMADGSGLYLHQQRGYRQIQDKTAGAVVREYELDKGWYDGVLHDCTKADGDRALLDYSSRDVVIDVDQATTLGMVTTPMEKLGAAKVWGLAVNVVAPEPPSGSGYPYSPFR